MRRVLLHGAPLLLSLLTGCYLLSDEPKARKQPGSASEPAPSEAGSSGAQPGEAPASAAAGTGELADCPAFLTGVETQDRTLASSCGPIRVRGQYRVEGGRLTVEAGVELRFEQGAVLEVGKDRPGVLTVAGTAEQPVRFVADYVGDTANWRGLRVYAQGRGSSLAHLELLNAGSETEAALWIAADGLAIEGLNVRRAVGLALELVAEQGPSLQAVTLAGAGVVARVSPSAAGQLHDLSVEPKALVALTSGTVAQTMEWPALRYRVEGVIRVEGEVGRSADLSLAAGASLHFTAQARLVIGGFGPGSLSAAASHGLPGLPGLPGEPGRPIRLLAAEDPRPGAWSGVHVQDQGQLSRCSTPTRPRTGPVTWRWSTSKASTSPS
jgi:hypothetical protein